MGDMPKVGMKTRAESIHIIFDPQAENPDHQACPLPAHTLFKRLCVCRNEKIQDVAALSSETDPAQKLQNTTGGVKFPACKPKMQVGNT
uniref:Uncharacterized protein n=1 Tax=Candidatus Nitrotoga fabula TaxID=2182327 RepID=A0A2X0QZ88_9PROT|nr:protein of unknown function [Candidatus Nitrotoga fabula]